METPRGERTVDETAGIVLPPPKPRQKRARTPEEQAKINAQMERVRAAKAARRQAQQEPFNDPGSGNDENGPIPIPNDYGWEEEGDYAEAPRGFLDDDADGNGFFTEMGVDTRHHVDGMGPAPSPANGVAADSAPPAPRPAERPRMSAQEPPPAPPLVARQYPVDKASNGAVRYPNGAARSAPMGPRNMAPLSPPAKSRQANPPPRPSVPAANRNVPRPKPPAVPAAEVADGTVGQNISLYDVLQWGGLLLAGRLLYGEYQRWQQNAAAQASTPAPAAAPAPPPQPQAPVAQPAPPPEPAQSPLQPFPVDSGANNSRYRPL